MSVLTLRAPYRPVRPARAVVGEWCADLMMPTEDKMSRRWRTLRCADGFHADLEGAPAGQPVRSPAFTTLDAARAWARAQSGWLLTDGERTWVVIGAAVALVAVAAMAVVGGAL